ncbi:hypothetical protein DPMN_165836 [Dreissena polymorpha]|uniref:Uncharacterized protein n=1 Tax=Dreissena polymorpha TaxID=45954 RepID=A0A9D4EXX8_DREPO|nr:hypothetical protein DPMN_165836 [Dreissena polymorpha]
MKTSACLVLLMIVSSMLAVDAQWFGGPRFGGPFGPYPYPYPGSFGRPGWGLGEGRGLALLGSAALLGSGNQLGQIVGGFGLGSALGFW